MTIRTRILTMQLPEHPFSLITKWKRQKASSFVEKTNDYFYINQEVNFFVKNSSFAISLYKS